MVMVSVCFRQVTPVGVHPHFGTVQYAPNQTNSAIVVYSEPPRVSRRLWGALGLVESVGWTHAAGVGEADLRLGSC